MNPVKHCEGPFLRKWLTALTIFTKKFIIDIRLGSKYASVNITLRSTLFRKTVAAFEVSFSIRKESEKKKVSGEITFALISLFYVQIQEPANRSTTTRAFIFLAKVAEFYDSKIVETRC